MISILSRLSMAYFLNPTDMHIPQSCYRCMADKLEDCVSNQMMINCSNATFPNVGSGHCYTAVGWYKMDNMWNSTALRGCVDCSGNHKQFSKPLKPVGACEAVGNEKKTTEYYHAPCRVLWRILSAKAETLADRNKAKKNAKSNTNRTTYAPNQNLEIIIVFGCRFLTSLVKGIFFSLSFFFSVFILSLPSIVIIAVINSNIVYDPGHKYILFLLGANFNDLRFEKTSTITIRNTDKLIQSQTLAPSRTETLLHD